MRISDWSSDVCSSDLWPARTLPACEPEQGTGVHGRAGAKPSHGFSRRGARMTALRAAPLVRPPGRHRRPAALCGRAGGATRSEEHTSELQSLMRISYAVFCLKKKIKSHSSTVTSTQLTREP